MVPKNSSIISSKRLPWSFVCAVLLVAATSFLLGFVPVEKITNKTDYSTELSKLRSLGRKSVLILGDSTAWRLDPGMLAGAARGSAAGGVYICSLGAAVPRAHLSVLESAGSTLLGKESLVVLWLNPTGLNKNNSDWQSNTVLTLFSWKELFTDIIPNEELRQTVVPFLVKQSNFSKVSSLNGMVVEKLRALLGKASLGSGDDEAAIDREKVDEALVKRNVQVYKDEYDRDYTLSNYQLAAINSIIDYCAAARVRLIIVLPPLSVELRKVFGRDNLKRYLDRVHSLATSREVPLIDYVSSYDGSEYGYYDGVHLITRSGRELTGKLVSDLASVTRQSEIKRKE